MLSAFLRFPDGITFDPIDRPIRSVEYEGLYDAYDLGPLIDISEHIIIVVEIRLIAFLIPLTSYLPFLLTFSSGYDIVTLELLRIGDII